MNHKCKYIRELNLSHDRLYIADKLFSPNMTTNKKKQLASLLKHAKIDEIENEIRRINN